MTAPPTPLCPKCSNELPAKAAFCPTCGTPTPAILTGAGVLKYEPPRPDAEQQQRDELQKALGPQYELRSLLGRGGFAEVYEAWDVGLKRTVAVKTLRKDLAPSKELIERFRIEAEAIAKLRHPHIIPIYAVGGDERRAFFIMPRIDGESLADALRRDGRFAPVEAARILREAAEALGTAHRAGILHRDVKPENIMLDGPERRALVMDFGIAKGVSSGPSELTGTGTVVGTPHYMSPEQASGERNLDARSDQYSLGVVAFRMLSGELPFDGDSLQSVIMKQITTPARPLGELAPDTPPELALIIDRILSKKPADRFASMDEVVSALKDVERDATQPASRRDRVTSMKDRVAQMHERLPGWKHPLSIAAIVAIIGAALLTPRSLVPTAWQVVGGRDVAQVKSQEFLSSRGVSGPFNSRSRVVRDSLAYDFLLTAVSRDSAEHFAAAHGLAWYWRTVLRRKADATLWRVSVSPDGSVASWSQVLEDSTKLPAANPARAESLAVAELRARGENPASLQRLADSVVTRESRVDRIVRWAHPAGRVSNASGDTARLETQVRLSGDRVTAYSRRFILPQRYIQSMSNTTFITLLGMVAILFVLGAVGVVIWLVAGPMRREPVAWRVGVVLAVAVIACSLPDFVLTSAETYFVRESTAQPLSMQVLSPIMGLLFLGIGFVVMFVCGDFLAPRRPSAEFAGLTDFSRRRFAVPELAAAAARGGVVGAFLGALPVVLGLALPASMLGVSRSSAPDLTLATSPAVTVLSSISGYLVMLLAMSVFQSLMLRWTKREIIALLAPVAVALMFSASDSTSSPYSLINSTTSVVVFSVLTLRYGVMTAAFAAIVEDNASEVIALILHPSGSGIMSGSLALLVLAVPFVLALIAYRRISAAQPARA